MPACVRHGVGGSDLANAVAGGGGGSDGDGGDDVEDDNNDDAMLQGPGSWDRDDEQG